MKSILVFNAFIFGTNMALALATWNVHSFVGWAAATIMNIGILIEVHRKG